jgi:amino-acid N-acetyltransferase
VHVSGASSAQVVIRKATVRDVPTMARIINGYASQGQMLPKSHHQLYQDIRDFVVATSGEEIVGCGALHVVWEDLAEIRSLAVVEPWQGKDVGRLMVQRLLDEARSLGLPQVFALTYHQGFFERLGFGVVPRESLPHKIWGDCLNCVKFPNCDEIALVLNLALTEEERAHEAKG